MSDAPARPSVDAVLAGGFTAWGVAETVAALLAVDPVRLKGVWLSAPAGPARDTWLAELTRLFPSNAPARPLPAATPLSRVLGGVSVERSLREGRIVAERGCLAEADGRLLVARMAERMDTAIAGPIAAALDTGEVVVEHDGISRRDAAGFALVLLDEGEGALETPPPALTERLAFRLDLSNLPARTAIPFTLQRDDILDARARLGDVTVPDGAIEAIVAGAARLGIASMRAPVLALAAARAHAALNAHEAITAEDLETAAGLVYAARAQVLPEEAADEPPPPEPPEPPEESGADTPDPPREKEEEEPRGEDTAIPDELLVEAVRNLALMGVLGPAPAGRGRKAPGASGKAGQMQRASDKGAAERTGPAGRPGAVRIDLIATLRSAAPWQKLRGPAPGGQPIAVRRDDIRVKRFKRRSESTVIFAVDASGSAAVNRLAEAKGAVELLLGDCYSRRDQVALVAFRGSEAELMLPPTRSLLRVRRSLAGLPAGGTTPLASGLALAARVAESEAQKGRAPLIVLLSDGRGNIALDGTPDRDQAAADLHRMARQLRSLGHRVLYFDTARRAGPRARALADALATAYRPLPWSASAGVSAAVRAEIAAS